MVFQGNILRGIFISAAACLLLAAPSGAMAFPDRLSCSAACEGRCAYGPTPDAEEGPQWACHRIDGTITTSRTGVAVQTASEAQDSVASGRRTLHDAQDGVIAGRTAIDVTREIGIREESVNLTRPGEPGDDVVDIPDPQQAWTRSCRYGSPGRQGEQTCTTGENGIAYCGPCGAAPVRTQSHE